MDVMKIIRESTDSMTKSEYRVAVYCLNNLSTVAFDTLDILASKIGTSTTSVIRFCRRLGYSGYKDFQDEVRSGFRYEPSLPDKLKRTVEANNGDKLLIETLSQSMACIDKTFAGLSNENLYTAVNIISKAKNVYTFGMKESFALAHYAYTRFLTVRKNVHILSAGYNSEIETLLSLTKDDVCVFYLFHRYTSWAVHLLKTLKEHNIPVILITSPPYDTVEEYASVILPCYVDTNGIKNSSVAPVCLADFLCNALAVADGDKTLEIMKKSEELFKQFIF